MSKTRAIGLVLLMVACYVAFTPGDRLPYVPAQPRYDSLWTATIACSGRQASARDFRRIQWYMVDTYAFPCPMGHCAGWWEPQEITIARSWEGTDWVVQHEMLHELTGHSGHGFEFTWCRLRWKDNESR